jgi:hypothetical protein
MRRRRSTSCSSGMLMVKGRIASPWVAAARCAGSRLAAPATAILIAAVPKRRRRSLLMFSDVLIVSIDEPPMFDGGLGSRPNASGTATHCSRRFPSICSALPSVGTKSKSKSGVGSDCGDRRVRHSPRHQRPREVLMSVRRRGPRTDESTLFGFLGNPEPSKVPGPPPRGYASFGVVVHQPVDHMYDTARSRQFLD